MIYLLATAGALAAIYYYRKEREEQVHEVEPKETYTREENKIETLPSEVPVHVGPQPLMYSRRSLVASTFAGQQGTYHPTADSHEVDIKRLNIENRYLYG